MSSKFSTPIVDTITTYRTPLYLSPTNTIKCKRMKKTVAMILTLLGVVGLIYGLITVFNGELTESYAWVGLILGIMFFFSGIGLLKTTRETT